MTQAPRYSSGVHQFFSNPSLNNWLKLVEDFKGAPTPMTPLLPNTPISKCYRVGIDYLIAVKQNAPSDIRTKDFSILNDPKQSIFLWLAMINSFNWDENNGFREMILKKLSSHLDDELGSESYPKSKTSLLWWLCRMPTGRQLILDHPELLDGRNLDASPKEGPERGKTVLWMLAADPNGKKFLASHPYLLEGRNLDAGPVGGPERGFTVFTLLAAWPEGLALLEAHPKFLWGWNLDACPQEGDYRGMTALWMMVKHPLGRKLLEKYPELLQGRNLAAKPEAKAHLGVSVLDLLIKHSDENPLLLINALFYLGQQESRFVHDVSFQDEKQMQRFQVAAGLSHVEVYKGGMPAPEFKFFEKDFRGRLLGRVIPIFGYESQSKDESLFRVIPKEVRWSVFASYFRDFFNTDRILSVDALFCILSKVFPELIERSQALLLEKMVTLAIRRHKQQQGRLQTRDQTVYLRDHMILPPVNRWLNEKKIPFSRLLAMKDAFIECISSLEDYREATIQKALESIPFEKTEKKRLRDEDVSHQNPKRLRLD